MSPTGSFRATTILTTSLRARIMGRFLRGARAAGTVVEQASGRAMTPSTCHVPRHLEGKTR
ncbi:MAG: hypothetical protein M3Z27_05260 [Actinomycetota bacterium]|nr:hypothetical protein [Actinomycetota bacterium]